MAEELLGITRDIAAFEAPIRRRAVRATDDRWSRDRDGCGCVA
eukprot:CAMPEP_0205928450 /NCGR_PEP_ID=MMETSP1325-20131115/24728_1 /ASSEMBLY_ACC=CAM_ASM_000708 /TAXON_ID=236786 /ORGANISM="Florenciella sp., Strain RCC1007" /LENGTH=42 /DNA_ID= /DNA_START= /DNA_END= /DNA_ORIENTATION=